jgi:hypothetical protein
VISSGEYWKEHNNKALEGDFYRGEGGVGGSLDLTYNNSKISEWCFEEQTGLIFKNDKEGSHIKFKAFNEVVQNGHRIRKRKTHAQISRDYWRVMHSFNNPILLNDYVLDEFDAYKERCTKRYMCFKDTKGQRAYSIAPTRYSRSYQRKVATQLQGLFKRHDFKEAVFLTLTFNPEKWTKANAWIGIGEQKNRFLTGLEYHISSNEKITSRKRGLKYVSTVEAHKNGYPHIHILFFGIKRLVDWREIEKLWSNGFIWINANSKGEKIKNPIAYMFKYITKTFKTTNDKNELTQAFLWYFTKRSYSVTQGLVKPLNEIKVSTWSFEGYIFFIGDFNEGDILAFLGCSTCVDWLLANAKEGDFG